MCTGVCLCLCLCMHACACLYVCVFVYVCVCVCVFMYVCVLCTCVCVRMCTCACVMHVCVCVCVCGVCVHDCLPVGLSAFLHAMLKCSKRSFITANCVSFTVFVYKIHIRRFRQRSPGAGHGYFWLSNCKNAEGHLRQLINYAGPCVIQNLSTLQLLCCHFPTAPLYQIQLFVLYYLQGRSAKDLLNCDGNRMTMDKVKHLISNTPPFCSPIVLFEPLQCTGTSLYSFRGYNIRQDLDHQITKTCDLWSLVWRSTTADKCWLYIHVY